jgi:hypothetical protein
MPRFNWETSTNKLVPAEIPTARIFDAPFEARLARSGSLQCCQLGGLDERQLAPYQKSAKRRKFWRAAADRAESLRSPNTSRILPSQILGSFSDGRHRAGATITLLGWVLIISILT